MFLKKFIKNILIIIIFIPIKLFAQESLVNFSGNIQTGYIHYDNYSFAPYFDKVNNKEYSAIARIIIESNNYDNFSYEMHALQTYNYSDVKTGVSGRSLSMLSADLGGDRIKNTDESAHYYIDRANVKFTTNDLDIYLGRLAVSFGKPHFWNLFDYYGSSYLNQDFKSGIDAIRIDKSFSNFSGVNIVVNKMKKYNESGSYLENSLAQSYQRIGLERKVGFLLRSYKTFNETDYALLYKSEPEGHLVGFEVDGEIGSLNIYNEITYLWGTNKITMPGSYQGNLLKNYFTNVLGINYRFNNDLQIIVEHLFNGFGDSNNLDASNIRYKNGLNSSLNEHVTGISLNYEFNPLLMGKYESKIAWQDSSHQHNITLTKSITDNLDFIAGGQINIGDRPSGSNWQNPNIKSEFGKQNNQYFFQLKSYF
jgi:hypothetical protein